MPKKASKLVFWSSTSVFLTLTSVYQTQNFLSFEHHHRGNSRRCREIFRRHCENFRQCRYIFHHHQDNFRHCREIFRHHQENLHHQRVNLTRHRENIPHQWSSEHHYWSSKYSPWGYSESEPFPLSSLQV